MNVVWHGMVSTLLFAHTESSFMCPQFSLFEVSYVFQFCEWKNDRRLAATSQPKDKAKCDETNELYENAFCMSLIAGLFFFLGFPLPLNYYFVESMLLRSVLIVYRKSLCSLNGATTFNVYVTIYILYVWSTYFTQGKRKREIQWRKVELEHCIINECNKPYGISLFSAFPIIAIVCWNFQIISSTGTLCFFPFFFFLWLNLMCTITW